MQDSPAQVSVGAEEERCRRDPYRSTLFYSRSPAGVIITVPHTDRDAVMGNEAQGSDHRTRKFSTSVSKL